MRFAFFHSTILMVSAAPLAFCQGEFAYPFTAKIQARPTTEGQPAESFFLPRSARLTSFDALPTGKRILCLSEAGSVLEWTADNRIRRVAEGFQGPIQARLTNDETVWVLDEGRGTLHRILPDGTKTRILGEGRNRNVEEISINSSPGAFDFSYFLLSRPGIISSAQLATDPSGDVFVFVATETRSATLVTQTLFVLRLGNGGTVLSIHWSDSKRYGDNLKEKPLDEAPPTPRIDALTIDGSGNIVFAINGQLRRLSGQKELRNLRGGNFAGFAVNPVTSLVSVPDQQTLIHTRDGSLFSSVIGPLDGDLISLGRLDGSIAREGNSLIAIDLFSDRLIRYQFAANRGVTISEAGKLLHTLPLTSDLAIRPAFDAASSVTVDTAREVFVVDGGDGNLYKISPNGAIRRTAATDFVPDRTPRGQFSSELFRMEAMPYPISSANKRNDGQMFLVDTNCNVFAQLNDTTLRHLGQISKSDGCQNSSIVFDTSRTLHVALGQGNIFAGTGDIEAGVWTFDQTYSGGNGIRSISQQPTGEFLVLEGDGISPGRLRIFNPTTRRIRDVTPDRSLQSTNLVMTSAVAMGGGGILTISGKQMIRLEVTDAGVLQSFGVGTPGRVALFGSVDEVPNDLFWHPLGAVVKSSSGRLFFYPNSRISDQDLLVMPSSQKFIFQPGRQDQEFIIPMRASAGTAIGFRAALTCSTYPYNQLVRLGPLTGQTPVDLTVRVQSDWVILTNGRCTIEITSVSTGKQIRRTEINLEPDSEATKKIPAFGLLDVLSPLRIDPGAAPFRQSLRIVNKSPSNNYFTMQGQMPEGVTIPIPYLSLEPYGTGQFDIEIVPSRLRGQNHQIPFRIECAGCSLIENATLILQLIRGASVMELSSETATIDGSTATLIKSDRSLGTYVTLSGIDPSAVSTSIDFRKNEPWFRIERAAARTLEPGRTLVQYDAVLVGAKPPDSDRSAVVTFAVASRPTVPKRYLTVFYAPADRNRTSRVETVSSGGIISLNAGEQSTVAVPILNRTEGVLSYSVSSIDGGGELSSAVAVTQGVIAKGANEILLNIAGRGGSAQQSESKDVVIKFSNGEQVQYRLGVIKAASTAGKALAFERAANRCSSEQLLIVPKGPSMPFIVVQNIGLRFVFEVRDICNQAINAWDSGKFQFAVQPPNGPVTATSVGNGIWEIFWKPERADENARVQVVAVRGVNEKEVYVGKISISGRVVSSAVPGLRSFAFVDAASFLEKQFTAPGSHISVFGDNLAASAVTSPDDASLPKELGNVEVLFDGIAVPLRYVSKTQINLQVPNAVGSNEYRMVVRAGDSVSAPASVVVGNVSPGIFTINSAGTGQGLIYRRNESGLQVLADALNPAQEGEEILVLASGLGITNPAVADGVRTPDLGEGIYHLAAAPVVIRIGGVSSPAWAALTPGLIGVYRVTASIPVGVTSGNAVPLSLIVDGQESQVVSFGKR